MRGKVRENIFKFYIWKNIYEEYINNCYNAEDNNQIFKWAEDFNIHSSKEDMRMASKYKKKVFDVMLLENCKSQPKWDITSQQPECLQSKDKQ